eukprot:CAMPEP_0172447724 /NCGR_PEP_ID=MMETSP1065-20121228/6964_1 /TAXON_ID=265537 /ORGANISM="Amphiprora paludosa, Strain CCMP125" /LENGTH=742 /DNA_ID=CAMNT_0013199087 /DNA_START=193 /DNA_END=2422 /DNA_ORIENTATION=-
MDQENSKELRQEIENSGLNERGLMTRLKRKQDLIDFLEEHHSPNGCSSSISSGSLATSTIDDAPISILLHDETTTLDEHHVEHLSTEQESSRANTDPASSSTTSTSIDTTDSRLVGSIDPAILEKIPSWLQSNIVKHHISSLLSIQEESFVRIFEGEDMVLHAPTGQGKTLAYCLPLLSQTKASRSNTKKHKIQNQRGQRAAPQIICLCPSRELAQQVGKEFDRFNMKDKKARGGGVAAVFGGVPIERHVSLLKRVQPRVLVATPGRLRELVREGYVDYSQVRTLVLDEADILLDESDSPDVRAILNNLEDAIEERIDEDDEDAYQMILVSATLNDHVRTFLEDMEIPKQAVCSVKAQQPTDTLPGSASMNNSDEPIGTRTATVQHWHMACKSSAQIDVTGDLITTLSPQVGIVFVPTKSETEEVAEQLSRKLGGADQVSIKALHGDMAQGARSRTLSQIRLEQQQLQHASSDNARPQVLVATDVASRGIDLPRVELVIQFGIPRQSGKEGTYNTDLYIHRTGRAGRVRQGHGQSNKDSNVVLLVDPATPDRRRLVDDLASDLRESFGLVLSSRPIPSSKDVIDAGYERAQRALKSSTIAPSGNLVSYFEDKLREDLDDYSVSDPDTLLRSLAQAMAVLSRVDPSVSPATAHRSLLSGDPSLRTLQVKAPFPVKPSDITSFCKGLGSGKVGVVSICANDNHSAIFDLPVKKAERLVDQFEKRLAENQGWSITFLVHLPGEDE